MKAQEPTWPLVLAELRQLRQDLKTAGPSCSLVDETARELALSPKTIRNQLISNGRFPLSLSDPPAACVFAG